MCGIVGLQGGFEAGLIDQMGSCIAHRGPDAEGSVVLEGSGCPTYLGHRRLAIIDLSEAGRQPMTCTCPRCGSGSLADLALVFNGEIYNYRELRAELVSRGHAFRSETDSEVLLHLYAEHGTGMLSRLNGIFAFAIHDGRERGRPEGIGRGDLFVARDPLGVKPLYYAQTARGFLFSSELKALLRSPDVARDLDLEAVHHTLAYLWTPAPQTVLEGVRKLPPGTACVVRGGSVARTWAYYDLPYGRPHVGGSFDEVAERVREAVRVAVERQMVSDVPVGAFLSGGLDSSAVVAMMREARPGHRPPCYSIGFREDESVDGAPADLPYARRVAEHLDVDLRVLEVTHDVIGQLERMLYLLDEPQADPAPINALLIAERARRDGIKVLLSGAGGDDIFSGYRRHYALRLERFWGWLPGGVRRGMGGPARWLGGGGGPARIAGDARLRRAVKAFAHADLAADPRTVSHFWWSGEALRRSLYSPAMAAATAGVSTAAPLLDSLARIPGERDPLNRMLYLEGRHFLADHNLNYTDKMGMAVGVEVRVPLLDLELVDLATRIPPWMKQRGRTGKAVFKRAMEGDLPRDVVYRPKSGFGAPLRSWLRNQLRDVVEDTLSAEALGRRGLFEPAAVRRLVDQDRAGRVDGSYTVFALMCLELWCRMFVDSPRPAPRADERTGSPLAAGAA
jgi:asparagine synthase (glutamine-hydrolysing)